MISPQIASRMFNTALMIDPSKMAAILIGLGGRIVEGGFSLDGVMAVDHVAFGGGRPSDLHRIEAGKLSDRVGTLYDQKGWQTYDRVGSVAVIPIEGSLVHKGGYIGQSSGVTSYQGIQTQVVRAARDPNIKGVVFEVDSFGGEVAGAFDTADLIAGLSAMKPTLAILTDHAASAGYLLASAARQIVIPDSGMAGSIGVITMHADLSKKLEADGVKVTILASGKHKADGHPAAPLGEDVKSDTIARLDRARLQFAAAVGKYRGDRLTTAGAMATEAAVYGGREAVRMGLADVVASPTQAFAQFVQAINQL